MDPRRPDDCWDIVMREVRISASELANELRRVVGGSGDLKSQGRGLLPPDVAERLQTAEAVASANATRVAARMKTKQDVLRVLLMRPLEKGIGRAERLRRLWKLYDTWGEAVRPESACRSGCSNCCWIGVGVLQTEAEAIGKFIGRKPRDPVVPENGRGLAEAAFGKACTFLKDGACSIYEVRPLACRGLFSLDEDNLLCRLVSGAQVPVPYADNTQIMTHMVMAMGAERMADIREWFPPQVQSTAAGTGAVDHENVGVS